MRFPGKQQSPICLLLLLEIKATLKAVELAKDMRAEGFSCLYDLNKRSLRASDEICRQA